MTYVVREAFTDINDNYHNIILVTEDEESALSLIKEDLYDGEQRFLEVWDKENRLGIFANWGVTNGVRGYGISKIYNHKCYIRVSSFEYIYEDFKKELKEGLKQ